jgi:hypothetical protein
VIAMQPLTPAQVAQYKLPATGTWLGAEVPAWNTAALLDYVFTDDRRAIWDNNGGTDFHTLLPKYATGGWVGASMAGSGEWTVWERTVGAPKLSN